MLRADESPWRILTDWRQPVAEMIIEAIEAACSTGSPLHKPMTLLAASVQSEGRMANRLLPLAVLGTLTGSPGPAVPVCAMSTLWWAGAEALDDLTDAPREQHGPTRLSPAELMIGGVACMDLVPQLLLARLDLAEPLRRMWLADLAECSLHAAEGQLADLSHDASRLTWSQVMRAYVGKTGAAYARDVVMAARLADPDDAAIRGWQAFGHLFGVLRQLRNDNALESPEHNEDLINGTPTLLLAHALETASSSLRDHLLDLRTRATNDVSARVELHACLHDAETTTGYLNRLAGLHKQACALLEHLTGPSAYRDIVRAAIDTTVALAAPQPGGEHDGTQDHRRVEAVAQVG